MKTGITATATREVQLKPLTKRKLMTELKAYASIREQKKALELAMKKHQGNVESILSELEESSISVDGFKATLTAAVRKTLSREKLIGLGVTEDQLRKATVESLGKQYVKISVVGEKDDDGE